MFYMQTKPPIKNVYNLKFDTNQTSPLSTRSVRKSTQMYCSRLQTTWSTLYSQDYKEYPSMLGFKKHRF